MYAPKHFKAYELVPKVVYDRYADSSIQFLDAAILEAGDNLRDVFGPCWVNNWHEGGQIDSAGLRPPNDPTGSPWSAHKQGKALDLKFLQATPDEVRDWILAHRDDKRIAGITRVELGTPTWVHIDSFNVSRIVWVPLPKPPVKIP